MANSNFKVQNGLEVGPTKIFAGNGTIVMGGGLESAGAAGSGATNFQQDINIVAGNLTVSTGNTAVGWETTAALTDNLITAAKDVNSFVQLAIHNGSNGISASTDFIAYADTGDNTQGYIDMGIASSQFNDPAYLVTEKGDGYIFLSAPTGTGGNLVIATEGGTQQDIVFSAGGFASGEVQGKFVFGDGLLVTGNLVSSTGAVYQGPLARNLITSTTATTTLNGTITNSVTTITLTSTTAFKTYGTVTIDSEIIRYTSKSSTQLLGCTRGYQSTTAASHTTGASVTQYVAGLTNSSGVFTGDANAFQQFAIKNRNTGSSASTDLIAYSANGDNDSGWMDMGITSGTYSDTTYGVTGPNDGYVFMSAPFGALGNGSMFISTSNNGSQNDIVFSTNGFNYGTERMRIVGVSRAGRPAGVEVNIATTSTSTTTGALRVQGGIGLQGNLYVGGNVSIVGNISFGGSGTTVSSQSLTVENPISFLGNSNPGNSYDTGTVGLYKVAGTTYYTGIVKQASTGYWRVFDNLTSLPTTTVSWAGTTPAGIYAGNITVANTTTSTSTTTGAMVVNGGLGVAGNLSLSSSQVINIAGSPGTSGQFLSSTGTGLNWVTLSASSITNGTSNVTVASSGVVTLGVTNSNVAFVSTTGIHPMANASVNLGDSTHWYNVLYGKAYQAQYADLAENYQADKAYPPGTVVMFGGAEEVTVADADATSVAGVVSTNPAHLMNGGLTGANVVPLALQGRVPCNVIGPVKKGDMMVSAGFGYAKASKTPSVGQVIGKALADFGGAKGQIEVVVGRV